MPSYKLQHYVPRCLLKQFSRYDDRKAIDLYNIKSQRLIERAPIKGQCARDYVYGNGAEIELGLSEVEADYSAAFEKVRASHPIDANDRQCLTIFLHVQFSRTMEAARRQAALTSKIHEIAFKYAEEPEPLDLSTKAIVRDSLSAGLRSMHAIMDLSLVVLRNTTDIGFIVSDNPVAILNEFYRARGEPPVYGLESSGLAMYLPMSPTLAILLYDSGVYTIPKANFAADVSRVGDVEYLNDLTFCNSGENIYFASTGSAPYFSDMHRRLIEKRKERRIEINFARYAGSKDGYDRFDVVKEDEFYQEGRAMFHYRELHPVLEGRLRLLKPRSDKKFVDTRSGRKIVRPACYERIDRSFGQAVWTSG